MKALVLEKNTVLKFKDVPDPKIKDDECLIAVKYAGICESDIARAFCNGAYFYPSIMGHEVSGIVEKAGNKVNRFRKGDHVAVFPLLPCFKCGFCRKKLYAQCIKYDYYGSRRNGGFAQFLAVKEWNLFKLPPKTPLEHASILEPVSVSVHAARKIDYDKNDNVVILGAGLIGLTMALYLKKVLKIHNIFIVDRNDHKLKLAQEIGAKTLNSRSPNWESSLLKMAGGKIAAIFEACGSEETYYKSVKLVSPHGNVIWAGNIKGDLLLDKKTVSSIIRREIHILGCWNSSFSHSAADDWSVSLKLIRNNGPFFNRIISHVVPLSSSAQMFKKLHTRHLKSSGTERFQKVLIKI
jgi:L-iditol 2-dehydrogenase